MSHMLPFVPNTNRMVFLLWMYGLRYHNCDSPCLVDIYNMDWNIRTAVRIHFLRKHTWEGVHTTVYISQLILFLYRDVDRHTYNCILCLQLLFLASISFCMLLYVYLLHEDNYVNISIGCSKLLVHCSMHISSWNGVGFLTARSSTYVSIMSFVGVQPSPWLLNNEFQCPSRIIYNTIRCPCLLTWKNDGCLHMTLHCFIMPVCIQMWGPSMVPQELFVNFGPYINP